jgi:surface antigen
MENFFSNIINRYHGLSRSTKSSLAIAGYGVLLLLVLMVVILAYRTPVSSDPSVANQINNENTVTTTKSANSYLNQVVEANLALGVAEKANLSVASNVLEKSATITILERLAQTEKEAVTKPIISVVSNNDAIVNYVTVDGDSVPNLAAQFGISVQTIKWANNLTSDVLSGGLDLLIPTVDGVVYTVKAGDTIDSIVGKYGSSGGRILAINDIDDIRVGEKIVLPGGELPFNERPGYSAPVVSINWGWSGNTAYAGNRYSYGYCTWYAYNRRVELGGRVIGSYWGNATSWAAAARSQGFVVDGTPSAGAIFQISGGWSGAGHVGIVEAVSPDGTKIKYSDMNGLAGWNRVYWSDWVPLPAGWNYIH